MKEKPPIHRSHNVYILGAGFSRPAGLPVIANFLDYMRESVNWLAANKRGEELDAVRQVFDLRLRAAGAAYRMRIDPENIEELFSIASADIDDSTQNLYTREMVSPDYVSRAIAATLDYAKSVGRMPQYRVLIKNKEEFQQLLHMSKLDWSSHGESSNQNDAGTFYHVPIYDFYAGLFSGKWCKPIEDGRNTVITFNYDILLEEALNHLGIPFTYTLPNSFPIETQSTEAAERLPVLKLHGSVNWARNLSTGSEPEYSSPNEADYIYAHDSYKELLETGAEPILVPPTWRKVFGGALTEVWKQSVKAIAEATRVIIVGFSLPPTDIHFRYLLAAGLQKNISLRNFIVVNYANNKDPNQYKKQTDAVKKNFDRLFQPLFRNGITWNFDGAQQFFGQPSYLKSIERELDESRFSQLAVL